MRNRKEEPFGLLAYLSLQAGCLYLSDLPHPIYRFSIQHALRSLSPKWFSLKEWNDAVEYITRQNRSFETEEQAWQFLLDSISLECNTVMPMSVT